MPNSRYVRFNEIKKSNLLFILILLAIDLIVYYRWFFDFSYLTAGDWSFHFKESISDFIYPPIWRDFQNLGAIDPLPMFYPVQIAYWILQNIGLDYNLLERLLYFWPAVLISSLGMYFFAKRLFKNRLIALVSSIAYSFNTIYISFLASWLTFAVVYSIIPLIFLFLFESLDKWSIKKIIMLGITLGISFSYEPRLSYVISSLMVSYLLYDAMLQTISKNCLLVIKRISIIIIVFSIVILLHFFWILPTILSTSSSFANKLATSPFASYNTILDVITLHNYAWNGESLKPFVRGELNVFLYLIPILSFGYLAIRRIFDKIPIFFSLVAIIGIFLVKQGNSPFPDTYEWLFNNLPTFKIFRESSKFWVLVTFSYSILIGYFLSELSKDRRWSYYLFVTLLILLFLWNAIPIINGNLGWTFVGKDVPQDYILLKNYLNSDNEYYRTLWVPEKTRFSFYNNLHPSIGLAYSINNEWNNYMSYKSSQFKWPINKQIIYILDQNYSKNLLDSSSIRYIIVPYDRDNETFIHYGKRDFFISELREIGWLKEVDLGMSKNTTVFENIGYKNHIYSPRYIFSNNGNIDDKDEYYNRLSDFTQTLNISDYASFYNSDIQEDLKNTFIDFEYDTKIADTDKNGFTLRYKLFEGLNYTLYWINPPGNDKLQFDGQEINISNNNSVLVKSKKENIIRVTSDNFNFTNMIHNPSFESGPWKNIVGDCNNFDNKPIIGMNLSNDSSDGNFSIELSAMRHIACTNIFMNDTNYNNVYHLKFDSKTVDNNIMAYSMQFSKEKDKNTLNVITTKDKKWNTYEKIIEPPNGSYDISLTIYAYGLGDTKPGTIVMYDNFELYALPKNHINNYFFVSDIKEFKTPNIKIATVNPGKYDIEIHDAKSDFPLILSESYDKGWKALINGSESEQIQEKYHFVANEFSNGWYINKTGNYTITLEYMPYRFYYLGLIVSISTLLILMILLIVPERKIKI